MSKIDIDKFVASLLKAPEGWNEWAIDSEDIKKALADQHLEYKDGEIVSTVYVSGNYSLSVSNTKLGTITGGGTYTIPIEPQSNEMQGEQKPFDYEHATITQKDFSPEEEMVGETKSKLTPFDKKVRDFLFSFYLKVSDGMPLTEMVDAVHQLYTMIFGVEQKPFDYENANIQQKDFAPINVTDEGIVEAIKNTSVLDMVEPKFKVGDYIVSDYCKGRVVELTDDAYLLDSGQGIPFSCEHNAHLWTIEDAKDGDVLVDKYGNIGIYQGYKNTVRWNSYCYCGVNKAFYDEGSHEFPCYPATKEQRELLFKKIKEAGYEGDAEKKELKIVDWSKYIKYEPNSPSIVEPKQEWSEKDEEMANDLIEGCLSSEKTHHLVHTSKEIED